MLLQSLWLGAIKKAFNLHLPRRARKLRRRTFSHVGRAGLVERLEDRALLAASIAGILNDTGVSSTDFITNNTAVTINGTATPGSTVTLTDNGVTLSNSIPAPGPTGNWSYSGTFTVGTHNLIASDPATAAGGSQAMVVDNVAPTVTVNQNSPTALISPQADPSNAATINFTAVFSKAAYGFTAGDVVVATGAGTAFPAGSAPVVTVTPVGTARTTFAIAVSGMPAGITGAPVTVSIPAGGAFDAAGNLNTASTSTDNTVTFDNVAPSVAITEAAGQVDPTAGSTINYTVVFSEPVTGFGSTGITYLAGQTAFTTNTPVAVVTGSGTTYNVAISGMDTTGSVRPTIAGAVATDAAGNGNTAVTATTGVGGLNRVFIGGAPAIGDVYAVTINGTTVSFTATAATTANVSLGLTNAINGNATLAALVLATDLGGSLSVNTVAGVSSVTLSVAKTTSATGSTGTITRDAWVQYSDTVAPTVSSIVLASANPTKQTGAGAANSVSFTVTFSELVTVASLVTGDFTVNQPGTGPALATVLDVTQVTAGTAASAYTVRVAGIDPAYNGALGLNFTGSVNDQTGNASTATFTTGQAYTVDHAVPTVGVALAAGQPAGTVANPLTATTVNFTVTFSEYVTGLVGGVSPAGGGAAGSFTVSGTAFSAAPTSAATVTVTPVSGNGTVFNVAVTGMVTSGTIGLQVNANAGTDLAGNTGPAAISPGAGQGLTYVDNLAPSVLSIVPSTAAGLVPPAGTPANPTNAANASYLVTFSEPVTGVDSGDFSLTNTGIFTTAPALTGAGTSVTALAGSNNTKWIVTLNTGAGDGTTKLNLIDNDSIVDTAGNKLGGTGAGNGNFSATTAYTIDQTKPSVTVNQAAGQADPNPSTTSQTVNFTAIFSEPVTGFVGGVVAGGVAGSVTVGGSAAATGNTVTVTGSGTTYNIAISNITNTGTISASIAAGAATILDAAGNTNNASTSTDNVVTFQDLTPPTVVSINRIAPPALGAGSNTTNAGVVTFQAAFSEKVFNVDTTDFALALTGAIAGPYNPPTTVAPTITGVANADAGAGLLWNVTVSTGTGLSGTLGLNLVDDDSISDTVGNRLGGPGTGNGNFTGQFYNVDKTPPAVTINQASTQVDPTNATTINYTVVFTEGVTGFGAGGITLGGPAAAGTGITVTGSGAVYNVAVTGVNTNGALTATVNAGAAFDSAGNANTISTSVDNSVTFDNVAPTVTSIALFAGPPAQPLSTTVNPIKFTVTFDSVVVGLDSSGIVIGGTATGTKTATVTGTGTTYTVTVNGVTGSGTVSIQIPAGATTDLAGNLNTASGIGPNVTFSDQTVPTVLSIVPQLGAANPTNGTTLLYTVTFSEGVIGVDTGDFNVSTNNITGGTFTVTGVAPVSSSVYTVTVGITGTPTTPSGSGTVKLNLTDDGSIFDLFGAATIGTVNPNQLGGPAVGDGNFTSGTAFTLDKLAPTVTINNAVSQLTPTSNSPVNFTAVFSEAVTGFSAASVVVSVGAGTAFNSPPVTPVVVVTGSGTTYNVAVSGMNGSGGNVIATINASAASDAAGNPSGASTSTTNTVVFNDAAAPTVLSINRAAGAQGISPTNAVSRDFTVTFSEPVTTASVGAAFAGGKFTVTTTGTAVGTVTAPVAVGAVGGLASTYTVTVNTISGDGTLRLDLADDDTIVDAGGNKLGGTGIGNGTFTSGQTFTIDNTKPSPTINLAAGESNVHNSSSLGSTINFAVNFGEALGAATPFTAAAINFAGSTTSAAGDAAGLVATVTGSGSTYNVAVTGMVKSGTVSINFAAGVAADLAGNTNNAPTVPAGGFRTVSYNDTTPPSVVSSLRVNPDPTTSKVVSFQVTFSEGVTGVDTTDFALTTTGNVSGAAVSSVSQVSNNIYTVVVGTGSGDGTIRLDVVDDDTIRDTTNLPLGGVGTANGNFTTGQFYTIDTTAPTVVSINRAAGQAAITAGSFVVPANPNTAVFTVTFSEAVTGVDALDFAAYIPGLVAGAPGITSVTPAGPASVYTVTVSLGTSAAGTVQLNLNDNDSILDLAGNKLAGTGVGGAPPASPPAGNGSRVSDQLVAVDKVAPTVTINQASGQVDPTGASPINYTVVFNDYVTGFTGSKVTLVSTAGTGVSAAVSSLSETASITGFGAAATLVGAGNGVHVLINGTAIDYIANATDTHGSVEAALAAAINSAGLGVTATVNGAVINLSSTTVAFSVYAQDTSAYPTFVTPGAITLTYNVAVTGMTQTGTVTASIAAGVVTDAAGNPNTVGTSTDAAVTYQDTTPPVVVSVNRAGATNPTNASSVSFTVTFSEAVTGVDTADFSLTNTGTVAGTSITSVTGSGSTYTVTVGTGTGDGTLRLNVVDDDTISDASGNRLGGTGAGNGNFSTGQTYTLDRTGPTVAITKASGQADPTNGATINFTVTFGETVTDFTNADVSLSGTATGTLSAAVTGSGTTYNVAVSGMTGTGTVIATVSANGVHDALGNGNLVAIGPSVTFDNTSPSVTINQTVGQADPTNGSSISYTAVFSKAVTGFTGSGVSFTGSTATGTLSAAVTGSGTTYTVLVSGMTGSGTVVASIPAGVATDTSGNVSLASTSTDNTVTFDNTPPSVTVSASAGQANPTNQSPISFTVTFSESVTGFTSSDVVLSGSASGTSVTSVTGSGSTYTVLVAATGGGTVGVAVPAGSANDAAGNANTVSNTGLVTLDTVAPTVTISNQPSQPSPTNASPVNFLVTFSEPVTGFSGSGVSIGGTAGATTSVVTGNGTTYNVAVSGMTAVGTVTASVNAGAATDAAGNPSAGPSSTSTYTFDNVAPTIASLSLAAGQSDPTNASTVNVTVVFSEPVVSLNSSKIVLGGTAGATTAVVTGSGTTFNLAISGMTQSGTITLALQTGAVADAAGNQNAATSSATIINNYDIVPPTVTSIVLTAGQSDPTNATIINVTVVFSESVTGFAGNDITLGGTAGATTAVVTGSGTTYNVAISGMTSSGTITGSLKAGAVSDAAGNTNAATSSTQFVTFDNVPPTVTINQASSQSDPATVSGPVNFTVVFSESVTGFTGSDVTLGGSAGATTATVTGSGTTYNVAVSGMTINGTVTATIAAGAATDAAGNLSTASTSTDNSITFSPPLPSSRFFRVLNTNNQQHFFTSSLGEYNALKATPGYNDETTGNAGFGLSPTAGTARVAIHRLYQSTSNGQPSGLHYYTTNDGERDFLTSAAIPANSRWTSEGDVGFIFTSAIPGTTAVFHITNIDPTAKNFGEHFFTTDISEVNGNVATGKWRQDTNLGFGVPQAAGVFTTGGGAQIPARQAAAMAAAEVAAASSNTAGRSFGTVIPSSTTGSVSAQNSNLGSLISTENRNVGSSDGAAGSSINNDADRPETASKPSRISSGLTETALDDFWGAVGAGVGDDSDSFWHTLN